MIVSAAFFMFSFYLFFNFIYSPSNYGFRSTHRHNKQGRNCLLLICSEIDVNLIYYWLCVLVTYSMGILFGTSVYVELMVHLTLGNFGL